MINNGASSRSGEEVICLFFFFVPATVVPKKMERRWFVTQVYPIFTDLKDRCIHTLYLVFYLSMRIVLKKKLFCSTKTVSWPLFSLNQLLDQVGKLNVGPPVPLNYWMPGKYVCPTNSSFRPKPHVPFGPIGPPNPSKPPNPLRRRRQPRPSSPAISAVAAFSSSTYLRLSRKYWSSPLYTHLLDRFGLTFLVPGKPQNWLSGLISRFSVRFLSMGEIIFVLRATPPFLRCLCEYSREYRGIFVIFFWEWIRNAECTSGLD